MDGAEALCRRNNQPPPTDLRIEPPLTREQAQADLAREGVQTAAFSLVPGCLRVTSGKATKSRLYATGLIFIQDAGSQLLPFLLDANPGDRVLDACAAPGAKATEIARWIRPGLLIALDKRPQRLSLMSALARRLGSRNVAAAGADAGALPFRRPFARILLDAPCSSLGTLARNPDIKWRLREEDLGTHAETQGRLLESCAGLLAPGGRLVYATCSTEPEENEDVVTHFLSHHPEFELVPPAETFPEGARRLLEPDGTLRIRPERDEMDGYFGAILRRRASN
jgi:16S rRNA (cytosine967-C5)-methyltransferase